MEDEMEMEFEWSDSEAKFLRVFLGKIFKRPYAAAWNTWKDKVESEKAEEEAMKKRKITKRMMKVLERQPQGERDQKGIDDITNWALDVHGDIFTKLNDSELKLACMHMKLRKLKANEVIFLQGWLGLEYIIIVSGSISIRVDQDLENTQRKIQIEKIKGAKYVLRMVSENPLFLGHEVVELEPGKGFGEVALFAGDGLRTASAAASKDSVVVLLEKDIYMETLKPHHMSAWETKNKIDFLQTVELFADWPSRRIADLSFIFEKVCFAKHATILEQGASPSGIYFLTSGEVKVVFYFSANHLRTFTEQDNHALRCANAKKRQLKEKSKALSSGKIKLPKKHFVLHRTTAPYREISLLGANTIVGAQCTLGSQSKESKLRSPYAVVSTQPVEAYFLPKESLSLFRQKSKGTKAYSTLENMFHERHAEYSRRLGKEMSTAVFAPRVVQFKPPFTYSTNGAPLKPEKPDGSGIIHISNDQSSNALQLKTQTPEETASWHMNRKIISRHEVTEAKTAEYIGFKSSVDPLSRQKWSQLPKVSGNEMRARQRKNSSQSFSRRSMALDRALDVELERHLSGERKRLGVGE